MSDSLDQLTAAILVGGFGTRLRSTVGERQKAIAPVAGRPFLYRLLDQVADAGIRRVVLCTGYKADQVAEIIGHEYRQMRIEYSPEPEALGTAGALRHALPLFSSDPILACNGDSFCETDLAAFWQTHRQHNGAGTLVVVQADDTLTRGRIETDPHDAITSFVEKGATQGPGWFNAGIYLLRRDLLESVPAGRAVSIERETFPAWVGRGLYVHRSTQRFLDIGTPESYGAAQQFFK